MEFVELCEQLLLQCSYCSTRNHQHLIYVNNECVYWFLWNVKFKSPTHANHDVSICWRWCLTYKRPCCATNRMKLAKKWEHTFVSVHSTAQNWKTWNYAFVLRHSMSACCHCCKLLQRQEFLRFWQYYRVAILPNGFISPRFFLSNISEKNIEVQWLWCVLAVLNENLCI